MQKCENTWLCPGKCKLRWRSMSMRFENVITWKRKLHLSQGLIAIIHECTETKKIPYRYSMSGGKLTERTGY